MLVYVVKKPRFLELAKLVELLLKHSPAARLLLWKISTVGEYVPYSKPYYFCLLYTSDAADE